MLNPDTLAAMRALFQALHDHPQDRAALAVYGQLPVHLADALEDLEEEPEG